MATGDEVIDLCDTKTIKSEDTAVTVPLELFPLEHSSDGACANVTPATEESNFRKAFTESWVMHTVEQVEKTLDTSPDTSTDNCSEFCNSNPNNAVIIPAEVAELVHNDCAIKFINHLAIFAINKCTEAILMDKVHSVTSDIDPQLNYRIVMGFHSIYERCIVLFYEALEDLTEIFTQFSVKTQKIVILWMYNMVDTMCKAHNADSSVMRNHHYIETLFMDFAKIQFEPSDRSNIFYDAHHKITLPTVPDTTNQSPSLPTSPVVPPAAGESPAKKCRGRSCNQP